MKRNNRAFTIVEIIIVIAVIGIIAAILVLALPKAIDEAREKSALSDAVNSVKNIITEDDELKSSLAIVVEKSGKQYVFGYEKGYEKPVPHDANPFENVGRDELIFGLYELGFIDAPLGPEKYTLKDGFENVNVYTGCRITNSVERYDVEVNTDMVLPKSEKLGVTWKTENNDIATVTDGVAHGKSVGKTYLTAVYGNMRIATPLYVGRRYDIRSFADIRAAVGNSDESVFLHPVVEDESGRGALRLHPDADELPLVIQKGKAVSFCSDRVTENTEGSDTSFYFDLYYQYENEEDIVDCMIDNNGGYLYLNAVKIDMENGIPSVVDKSCCLKNREGGYVYMKDCEIANEGTISGLLLAGILDGLDEFSRSIYDLKQQRTDYAVLNVNGELYCDNCTIVTVRNCKDGVFNAVGYESGCTFERLLNEGTVYTLSNIGIVALGNFDFKLRGIVNTGVIYEIKDTKFHGVRGSVLIDTSAPIYIMDGCSFQICLDQPYDRLKKQLTDEQIKKYKSTSVKAMVYTDGYTGIITNCTVECDGIDCIGSTPVKCIMSGVFTNKPDERFLAEGSICSFNDTEKMYKVENKNN